MTEIGISDLPESVYQPFSQRVEEGDPELCWEWKGTRSRNGCGTLAATPFPGVHRDFYAHRIALHLAGVEIKASDLVLHSCDNPPCCNPNHLRVGTQADNVQDRVDRGRGNAARGESHVNAKLTEDIVSAARRRHRESGVSTRWLAGEYGVSAQTMWACIRVPEIGSKKGRCPAQRHRPEVNAPPFAPTTKGKPDALQYTRP